MNELVNIYMFEVGVLVDESYEEYEHYHVMDDVDYGFYDEDREYFIEDVLETKRKETKDYVAAGGDNTYGIIMLIAEQESRHSRLAELAKKQKWLKLSGISQLSSDAIVYSVTKRDGQLIEGFIHH